MPYIDQMLPPSSALFVNCLWIGDNWILPSRGVVVPVHWFITHEEVDSNNRWDWSLPRVGHYLLFNVYYHKYLGRSIEMRDMLSYIPTIQPCSSYPLPIILPTHPSPVSQSPPPHPSPSQQPHAPPPLHPLSPPPQHPLHPPPSRSSCPLLCP